jgi:hypothetical protein
MCELYVLEVAATADSGHLARRLHSKLGGLQNLNAIPVGHPAAFAKLGYLNHHTLTWGCMPYKDNLTIKTPHKMSTVCNSFNINFNFVANS